jgi:transposase InsO family protein
MTNGPGQEIALFRFQVIAPLLTLSKGRGLLKQAIEGIAEQTHQHPLRGPVKLAFATIEEWLYLYRRGGFDGLCPASRCDRGQSRAIDDELAERIVELATGRPDLDGRGVLAELEAVLGKDRKLPSPSSLYRFLRSRGLDQRRAPRREDHRAYAFELAGDCWQGDVMYGPSIPSKDGKRRKTYLIAIIDDATRLIAHAQFYFEQHLRSLKDCMRQAFWKRGLPRRFYFDQGMIFRSRLVLQICARLGIILIHSRPYRPQGRAKIERWFGSVRRLFLRRVDLNKIQDLSHLNRLLFAWIEGEYHVKPHRGLGGQTPLDRWVKLSEGIRSLPREVDLDALFLEETTRRVAKDGTLALKGKTFEAGPELIGERVKVLFDPFDLRRVIVETSRGKKTAAYPVDLYSNRHVRRNPPKDGPATTPPELKSMEDLAEELECEGKPEEEKKEKEESDGE